MSSTDQHVEPIRPGGGLRRLRRGEIASPQSEQTACSYPQFAASLKSQVARAGRDDTSVLLARLRFDALPGTANDSVRAQDLPDELVERMRAVHQQLRVTVVSPTEALILIPSLRRRADGEELANRLGVTLTSPVEIDGLSHHLSPRLGAALFDQENQTVDDLLEGARLALDAAENGVLVTMFHPYQRVRFGRQNKKEQELRDAVLNDGITADLQPAYDLATGRLISFEAFARWHRDGRPSVAASEFIPMAVEIGVMPQVSRQVIDKAVLAASQWLDEHESEGITLWLNVTPDEIRHPEFGTAVTAVVDAHPKLTIGLEVRPGVPAGERDVHRILTGLVARGTRAAVADFGVGPANLATIEQSPYDSVKIGRDLTRQMVHSANGPAIVESLVTLAGVLGLEITAQGIESREQAEMVEGFGATAVQGYLYAQPTSEVDTIAPSIDNTPADDR